MKKNTCPPAEVEKLRMEYIDRMHELNCELLRDVKKLKLGDEKSFFKTKTYLFQCLIYYFFCAMHNLGQIEIYNNLPRRKFDILKREDQ